MSATSEAIRTRQGNRMREARERHGMSRIAAGRQFVGAFADISTSGGGKEARLRIGDGTVLRALDCWMGSDYALDELALALCDEMAGFTSKQATTSHGRGRGDG